MIAAFGDQKRIVPRSAAIQHPNAPRTGIKTDDITVAKVTEATRQSHRNLETFAVIGRTRIFVEQNRRFEC